MSEEKAQKEPRATGGAGGVGPVIAEYRSAQRYRRWVLRLIVIAILAVVIIGIFRYYAYGKGVIEGMNSPETLQVVEDRVTQTLVPKIRERGEELFKDLRPKVVALAREKADEVRPEVTRAFNREQEIFKRNVRAMLEEKGAAFMTSIVEEHKESFQAKFPDIGDPIKMANLVELLVRVTRDVANEVFLDRRLDPHLDIIKAMHAKFGMLPVRDASETDKELLNRAGEIAWELWGMKTSKRAAAEGATPVVAPRP